MITFYSFQENSKENANDISKLHRAVLLLPGSQLKTHIIQNRTHKTKKTLEPVLKDLVDNGILIYEKVKTNGRLVWVYQKSDLKNQDPEALFQIQESLASFGVTMDAYENAYVKPNATITAPVNRTTAPQKRSMEVLDDSDNEIIMNIPK